ncbi:MAG: hypothetical protein D6691_00335 [Candidatus Hydrogenedentota bacterium]|nr:MAG: hypothetical protein D6691_00335 [Candidatus Hydrogenedentota bacterium]GIX43607.1 MAG: hypothetical protein KatS3mg130_0015 [Candidatus Sumerlaea sp.]
MLLSPPIGKDNLRCESAQRPPESSSGWLVTFAFLVGIPLICHVLFSRFGFNPTDEGFTLAQARRVWEGQVPHRDFLSIRPVLPAYLWAPIVALGSEYTFLLSRALAWVQWAVVAWGWLRFVETYVTRRVLATPVRLSLACASLMLGIHTFPVMAWHTLDGLFFLSLGAWCLTSRRRWVRAVGWCFAGMAPLCKQSFFLAPLGLLLAQARRVLRGEIGLLFVPALGGILFLLVRDALQPAIHQLTAQRNLIAVGYFTYALRLVDTFLLFVGGAAIATAGLATRQYRGLSRAIRKFAAPAYLALTSFALAWPEMGSFSLFSFALGLGLSPWTSRLFRLPRPPAYQRATRLIWASLLIAWCTSLSVAQNSPALAMGILGIGSVALMVSFSPAPAHIPSSTGRWLLAATAVLACIFVPLRYHRIYRDAPATELRHKLNGVVRGAKGIYTNKETVRFLAELRHLTDSLPAGTRYAILPDCAAWWVAAPIRNPLTFDWDNEVEFGNPAILKQAEETLAQQRGKVVVFVCKYETDELATRLRPLRPRYPLTAQLRTSWQKVRETEFFEIYE